MRKVRAQFDPANGDPTLLGSGRGDAESARAIMDQHVCAGQSYMEACETEVISGFLRVDG